MQDGHAAVVHEEDRLGESDRLHGPRAEQAARQPDRAAVPGSILRPPAAEVPVVVVEQEDSFPFAHLVNGARAAWVEQGQAAVSLVQGLGGAPGRALVRGEGVVRVPGGGSHGAEQPPIRRGTMLGS